MRNDNILGTFWIPIWSMLELLSMEQVMEGWTDILNYDGWTRWLNEFKEDILVTAIHGQLGFD